MDGNPYSELADIMRRSGTQSGAGAACKLCRVEVTRVIPQTDDGRGPVDTAAVGELPLEAGDIVLARHVGELFAPGDMLLTLTDDDQTFYCIGVM